MLSHVITTTAQVIIPKAYTSKAIVFCDGVKGRCFLSDSFNRMLELQVMGLSSPLAPVRLVSLFYRSILLTYLVLASPLHHRVSINCRHTNALIIRS